MTEPPDQEPWNAASKAAAGPQAEPGAAVGTAAADVPAMDEEPPGPGAESILDRLRAFLSSPSGASIVTWSTRLLLAALLIGYVGQFGRSNWGMLTDPALQNDDARTILFPFHRYGTAGTLAGDPIAEEMLSAVPWGVRALYRVLVPFFDIYVTAKLVQAIAFGVLAWAAVVLTRARRTGFAAAALLVFLFLHTSFAVDRVAGGLPRAFGFPCFALWLAGVLAHNRAARFSAPVILALSYPSVMNIILAAEGILAVRGAFRIRWAVVGRRLRRYAVLVGVCLVCVLPAALGSSDRGAIHTLEQAEKEPAFGRKGRLWILPFAAPVDAMSKAFVDPLQPAGSRPLPALDVLDKDKEMVAVLIVALFLLIPLFGWGPAPRVGAAVFVGASIVYALSRTWAFALYSPERYYSFGMRMACWALLMASAAHIWFFVHPRFREIARNITAFALIGILWLTAGSGFRKDTGMIIDRKTDAKLYEFMRTLPKDARFAAHILDGDGIPFWGARAHTGSFETLQPWFTDSWARQKKRTNATLAALYSTNEKELLGFADEYKVTHFLVNRGRYGRHLKRKAGSFEPFTSETRKLLSGKKHKKILFNKPPKAAVVFQQGRFSVVSVEKLRSAWMKE